jgi:restriction endonuclease S subunit
MENIMESAQIDRILKRVFSNKSDPVNEHILDIFRGPSMDITPDIDKNINEVRASNRQIKEIIVVEPTSDLIININNLPSKKIALYAPSKRYLIQDGDILINCRSKNPLVCLVKMEKNIEAIPSCNTLVIRPNSKTMLPTFLLTYLSSPFGKTNIPLKLSGTMTVIKTIDMKKMKIPVIDIKRQKELSDIYLIAYNQYISRIQFAEWEFNVKMQKLESAFLNSDKS